MQPHAVRTRRWFRIAAGARFELNSRIAAARARNASAEGTQERAEASPPRSTLTHMLECVANISEGRDAEALRAVAKSCGESLVDVHADPDHHRSVFTLAGPGPDDAEPAARDL